MSAKKPTSKPKAAGKSDKEKRYKQVALNRKASYEYTLTDKIEAGLVLTGTEVKSLRSGRASLNEAFAGLKNGEIWLLNAHIYEFAGGNRNNHEPTRPRKLLLQKKQMTKLIGLVKQKGTTLVPLSLYFNERGFAKVLIAVGVGKKEYDKRESEKKRDWDRQKARMLKK